MLSCVRCALCSASYVKDVLATMSLMLCSSTLVARLSISAKYSKICDLVIHLVIHNGKAGALVCCVQGKLTAAELHGLGQYCRNNRKQKTESNK